MALAQARQKRKVRTGADVPAGAARQPDTAPAAQPRKCRRIRPSPGADRHQETASQTELDRLRKALGTVAELVSRDIAFAPIFTRLEEEIALEEAKLQNDILARARALIRQSAIG